MPRRWLPRWPTAERRETPGSLILSIELVCRFLRFGYAVAMEHAAHFDPTPEAVRAARELVRQTLADRVDPAMTDELVLAVSEMATNAVNHAGTPFDVNVSTNGHIRIEVADRSSAVPVRRTPTSTAAGGRGLGILDEVCDRWGIEISQNGKCIWCEHQASATTASSGTSLPPG